MGSHSREEICGKGTILERKYAGKGTLFTCHRFEYQFQAILEKKNAFQPPHTSA